MQKPAAQSSAACRRSSRWVFPCPVHCIISCMDHKSLTALCSSLHVDILVTCYVNLSAEL